jgi:hypothetical protein
MYKYTLSIVFFITFLFSGYSVGDRISTDHQNMEFGYCYPTDSLATTFSFANHIGKVIMLERSTTW